ncbi:MAG: SGNH/GDSL hydrolase family protein [Acidimicrobiales bacterium]
MPASPLRRALAVTAALPLAAAAVIGAEIVVAGRGATSIGPPAGVNGCLGCTAGGNDEPRLRMVWLGDSTAAGVGVADPDETLPRQVAAGLGQPVELSVLARSGAQLSDVVDDQLPAVAALRPDVVLVSVGANDATHLTTVDAYASDWDRLGMPGGARLIALGIPDMGSPPRLAQPLRALAGWRGRRLDRAGARRVTRRGPATYVDIAEATGPAFRRDPDRYFSDDRYHPNAEGYRLWAEAVLEELR